MDAWLYLSNVLIGVVVWAVTKYGIPWTNREFHTHIPDGPGANAELVALIQRVWQPEIERHLKLYHNPPATVPAQTHFDVYRPPPTAANPNPSIGTVTASTSAPAATTIPNPGVTNA